MRRCVLVGAVLGAYALLGVAHLAYAQVIVLEPGASATDTSLIESVRIQLSGTRKALQVQSSSAADGASAQATRLVNEGAELVVWLEAATRRRIMLRYVGRRAGQVSAGGMEINAAPGPSRERTLGLKVREVLDEFVKPVAASEVARPSPSPDARGTRGAATQALDPLAQFTVAGASGSGNVAPQLQLGGAAGFGTSVLGARGELWLGVRWASPLARTTELGSVAIHEWSPLLEARAAWPGGALDFGGHARVAVRVVSATGTRVDGERGRRTELVPTVTLGPSAGLAIASKWSLRCAVGVELALRAQRFAVDEQSLLDLGRMRASADISAVFSP